MTVPKPPPYRTTNWHVHAVALARRRSLSTWFDPETQWLAAPTGKRGRQPVFTDAAVQTCMTLKAHFCGPLTLPRAAPGGRVWHTIPELDGSSVVEAQRRVQTAARQVNAFLEDQLAAHGLPPSAY